MIISRTPLRISFLGGGTDFPIFFKKNRFGCVLSTSINKYIYVGIKQHGELFNENYRLNYSNTEIADNLGEIRNDIIRESLKFLKIKEKIYISTISDIPANNGLGSSSAFCVGLLKGLYHYKGINRNLRSIACEAAEIEKDIIGKNVGLQDHFASTFGGLNFIKFYKNKTVLKKLSNNKVIENIMKNHCFYFTNKFRKAENILKDQVKEFNTNENNLLKIRKLAVEGYKSLNNKNYKNFFLLIDESWNEKKKLTKKISNNKINEVYKKCLKIGAYSGKISGAGGGGFLNIFAKPVLHKKIDDIMSNAGYRKQKVLFENSGTISFKVK